MSSPVQRAKHTFLPPGNIHFRVKTNHLGTRSPHGRGTQWLSSRSSHPQTAPWTSGKYHCHLHCCIQTPGDSVRHCRMVGRIHGHNKERRQLFPSWLYLVFLPLLLTCLGCQWDWIWIHPRHEHFLTFLFLLSCCLADKNEGVGSAEVSIHIFPSFHQWCNLPVAWISVPIVKALPSSQRGTARHSKTPSPGCVQPDLPVCFLLPRKILSAFLQVLQVALRIRRQLTLHDWSMPPSSPVLHFPA